MSDKQYGTNFLSSQYTLEFLLANPDIICQAALEKWGVDAQIMMAYEECGELISVLASSTRENKNVSNKDIVSEIADVLIVADQLRHIFGADQVDAMIDYKRERVSRRLGIVRDD